MNDEGVEDAADAETTEDAVDEDGRELDEVESDFLHWATRKIYCKSKLKKIIQSKRIFKFILFF